MRSSMWNFRFSGVIGLSGIICIVQANSFQSIYTWVPVCEVLEFWRPIDDWRKRSIAIFFLICWKDGVYIFLGLLSPQNRILGLFATTWSWGKSLILNPAAEVTICRVKGSCIWFCMLDYKYLQIWRSRYITNCLCSILSWRILLKLLNLEAWFLEQPLRGYIKW